MQNFNAVKWHLLNYAGIYCYLKTNFKQKEHKSFSPYVSLQGQMPDLFFVVVGA